MPDFRRQIRDHYDAQALSSAKVAAILRDGGEGATGAEAREKVTAFPGVARRGWRPMLALAAVLALFAGLALWRVQSERRAPFAVLAPRVIEFFGGQPVLPKISQSHAELRAWLLARGAPADFQIPAKLENLQSYGCDVLPVAGHPAYLMCFWREPAVPGAAGELVHLLVTRHSDFRDAPASVRPELRELAGWSFGSWAEGDLNYTLATAAPLEKLRPFLAFASSGSRLLAFAPGEDLPELQSKVEERPRRTRIGESQNPC